jgi:hypothetical protein
MLGIISFTITALRGISSRISRLAPSRVFFGHFGTAFLPKKSLELKSQNLNSDSEIHLIRKKELFRSFNSNLFIFGKKKQQGRVEIQFHQTMLYFAHVCLNGPGKCDP